MAKDSDRENVYLATTYLLVTELERRLEAIPNHFLDNQTVLLGLASLILTLEQDLFYQNHPEETLPTPRKKSNAKKSR